MKDKKLLFYYCGKPVYEGDETHQMMERCTKEFNGDFKAMALHDAKEIEKILNGNKNAKSKRKS